MKHQDLAAGPLHQPAIHESGYRHASGRARYVDDLPLPPGTGHGYVVTSPHAHARIVSRDAAAARAMPGVRAVLFAADVPGSLHIGPIVHDEELLAREEVLYVGHPVALVVADDLEQAKAAAAAVRVEYEGLPAILGIEQAIAAG